MSDATDAWEAWHNTRRALHHALPWTADWLRLRTVEQDLRATYFAMMYESADASVARDGSGASGEPRDRVSEIGAGAS